MWVKQNWGWHRVRCMVYSCVHHFCIIGVSACTLLVYHWCIPAYTNGVSVRTPLVYNWCIRAYTIGVSLAYPRVHHSENNGTLFHIRTSYHLPPLTLSCTGEYAQSRIETLKINALRSSEPFDDWFVVNSLWQWCYGGANEVVKVTMGILWEELWATEIAAAYCYY